MAAGNLPLFVGFFFTEFMYLSSITEALIAPPKPYVFQTLGEAVNAGYRIGIETITAKDLFSGILGEQGSMENNYSYSGVNPSNKTLNVYSMYSLSNSRITYGFLDSRGSCEFIPKLYSKQTSVMSIVTKFPGQVINIYQRVAFDSGLRMFWLHMQDYSQIWFANRFPIDTNRVESIFIRDERFQSVLYMTLACLSLSFSAFLVELVTQDCLVSLKHSIWKITTSFLNYLKLLIKSGSTLLVRVLPASQSHLSIGYALLNNPLYSILVSRGTRISMDRNIQR